MDVKTVAEQLIFTTANLECRRGSELSAGTGFIYGVETAKGTAQFLVTNRHVAEGAADGMAVRMVKGGNGRPALGQLAAINLNFQPGSWTMHPDKDVDVAVLPFGQVFDALVTAGTPPFYRSVPSTLALTAAGAAELDALEEVVFIGYPNNLYDQANLTPIMRRGITATPVVLDYNGDPAFLIDASVFPGSSGSPVFIMNSGMHVDRDGNVNMGASRCILLGVLGAVHVREVEAGIVQTQFGLTFKDPLNLGIVYKASTIDECVDLVLDISGLQRVGGEPSQAQGPTAADEAVEEAADSEEEVTAPSGSAPGGGSSAD